MDISMDVPEDLGAKFAKTKEIATHIFPFLCTFKNIN